MWEPQTGTLEATGYSVLAPDLRGFGARALEPGRFSHARDVEALVDRPATVVGNSLGGRVALQLALLRPDLVERLVLVAPALPDWEWSAEVRQGWEDEETAFDRGDLDAAAETSLRLWVDGPRRSPDQIDAALRAAVREMILRSYELQRDVDEELEEDIPGGPVSARLGEIRCPTLVLVGEDDVPDMRAIAAHVAASIDGARLVTVSHAAHLPTLERPDETNALLLAFLAGR
jgi:3-oxoadipate enol-lactonase